MNTEQTYPVVIQHKGESRKDYLLRVTVALLEHYLQAQELIVKFDDAECDGACLAEDIKTALKINT